MFRWADDYFKSGLTGGVLAKKLALNQDGKDDRVEPNDISEGLFEKEQTLLMPP